MKQKSPPRNLSLPLFLPRPTAPSPLLWMKNGAKVDRDKEQTKRPHRGLTIPAYGTTP